MNIYISVEITLRELDSSLLLATLAASRGHQVIVSDLESIIKSMNIGLISPGIFHTKSLTPADHKITRHKAIIDKGFKITSLDEEAGLDIRGHNEFAKTRYSDKTIEQSSAIFGWGPDDVDTLKKAYPRHSSKIHKTGGPRSDLWKSRFIDYWGVPKKIPKRPFLLVSSNMSRANVNIPFHEIIRMRKKSGYYKSDPKELKKDFVRIGEDFNRTLAFINAIKYLANNNNGYDIVLRPHPSENFDAWKFYLEEIPNVHVIREGSISAWVNNAFAIMHNRCTTALEATVSKKPVITYIPFKTDYYHDTPSNSLGHRVETLDDLLRTANDLFDNRKSDIQNEIDKSAHEIISQKVFLDDNELAAEKMINVWDNIATDELSKSNNWMIFKWFLKALKLRKTPSKVLKSLLPSKFGYHKENQKFPSLNKNDIYDRFTRLQKVLGIKGLKCELLSDRTILIKGKKFI